MKRWVSILVAALVLSCTAERTGVGGSCTDGIQNQDETDVDCGGNTCSRCPVGRSCVFGLDCQTGVCDAVSGECEPSGACGNGTVEDGEGCDDGALIDGDGCNADCFVELGAPCSLNVECASAACDTQVTGECVLGGVCGNGIVEPGEGCDFGDVEPGDGCDADCLRELAERCQEDNQCASTVCDDNETPDVCEPPNTCGNGRTEGTEACDDGNTSQGDGCSANCLWENGEQCASGADCQSGVCDENENPDVCEPADVCGNGEIEPGNDERCDDGNTNDDDDCDEDCLVENGAACTVDMDCQSGICDTKENPDVCEPADMCGNSVRELGEGCDDGNLTPDDGCNENCLLEQNESCILSSQCAGMICVGGYCQ